MRGSLPGGWGDGPFGKKSFLAGTRRERRDPERAQGGGDQVDGAAGAFDPAVDEQRGRAAPALWRWRAQTCGGQMTFSMPVSSSRLMNTTPRAVGGRCRWVTRPATATAESAAMSSPGTGPTTR